GVEDRPLGVGALGAVGELGEVALPGRDRLFELLLALEHLADLERGGHGQRGEVALRLVGLGAEAFVLEEGVEGRQRLAALAARTWQAAFAARGCAGYGGRNRRSAATPRFKLVSSGGAGTP